MYPCTTCNFTIRTTVNASLPPLLFLLYMTFDPMKRFQVLQRLRSGREPGNEAIQYTLHRWKVYSSYVFLNYNETYTCWFQ